MHTHALCARYSLRALTPHALALTHSSACIAQAHRFRHTRHLHTCFPSRSPSALAHARSLACTPSQPQLSVLYTPHHHSAQAPVPSATRRNLRVFCTPQFCAGPRPFPATQRNLVGRHTRHLTPHLLFSRAGANIHVCGSIMLVHPHDPAACLCPNPRSEPCSGRPAAAAPFGIIPLRLSPFQVHKKA
jgi:hypothetical protein